MNITIRHAKVKDAETIAQAERAIAEQPGFFCSQPSELTNESVANTIATLLRDKTGVYFVVECEGQLVGHAFLEPHTLQSLRHVVDLNIAVHLGWQNKGIGTKLLEQIIDWAKKSAAIEKIQLNVRASNNSAISLYKKFGFQEEGRLKNRVKVKDYYIDDIVMGLELKKSRKNLYGNQVHIRLLQQQDIEKIGNLYFPWSTKQETIEKWKGYFEDQENKTRKAFLVVQQDLILGYASLLTSSSYPDFRNKGIPVISDLWVYKQSRKRGLATLLIGYLEQQAKQEGYTQMGIGVGLYRDYGPAQKLYFRLGYKPDGEGITYKFEPIIPGEKYPVDDDLILWLIKAL